MDVNSVKALLQLSYIQNLDVSGTGNTTNSDIFTDLLSSVLSGETELSSELANTLGGHAALGEALKNGNYGSHTSVSDYVSAFLLNGATPNNSTSTIEQYSADYTGSEKYENLLAGAEKYASSIAKASATYNVPEKLIASIMKQESNFNPTAKSSAGATGLMQLMPSTAKYLGVQDSTNPEQNIMGGTKYISQLLKQFDGDTSLALAAYNAGPGNVKKYDGIPPFKETQKYVTNVMKYYTT